MINCVQSKLSRMVTQIKENQFLVEGEIEVARFGFQADERNLNFADIQGGPLLHIGQDFFGRGKIKRIEKINSDKKNYIRLKVTLSR
jgi:hypothetical protein